MPHNKVQRGQPGRVEMQRPAEQHLPLQPRDPTVGVTYCCVPTGCDRIREDPIRMSDPGDSVKVYCNNEHCEESGWMHRECFEQWEQHVLGYLRTCGRARSWSEKQRLQNLWTKKGYDLAFKACDCKCGRGHLRKDLDYVPIRSDERKSRKGKKKAIERPIPMGGKSTPQLPPGLPHPTRPQLRIRTGSFGSTGSSSPPSSASLSSTPPLTPNGSSGSAGANKLRNKFDFFADANQAAAGNIFKRRTDFSVFNSLPRYQQNPYHIKMEDEGPHGNDEIRCFILTNLSTHQITNVQCVTCSRNLPVFDRYPLIDGTFFLSPLQYNSDIQVLSDGRMHYLNAICLPCLKGDREREMRCQACKQRWSGNTLVIGTMYAYDIFAAQPCCGRRLTCKNCCRLIMDPGACAFQFFSDYSRSIQCPHCRVQDYHFVKSLPQCFYTKQSIRI